MSDVREATDRAHSGGPQRHHEKSEQQGKLPVRERVARLLDADSMVEDGLLANWDGEGLGADGVVTGTGTVDGRPVAFMANDPTVKAGSWGPKTVEKILRIQEKAQASRIPMVYLVDSAGARITEQTRMFPGRRHAGRIFFNEVRMSGVVPQVCVLFGPSAAGGAYIPAFCDVVIMREGNASMYLGSPRMAEMVIGEKVTLEEMGGAKMHTSVSGVGHFLVPTDEEGIDTARRYLGYFPSHWEWMPPFAKPADPASDASIAEIVPADENKPFDMRDLLDALLDADSFLEVHKRWARELIVGYGRLNGRVVGVVASQPKFKGGVLFSDSADKAARFIWTCNAFNVPLLFLADVPGFMIGTAVERQGIIRHGAKMISAVSEATVPKLSVIVRKAYGAGLYAMAGPAFDPDACIALPTASIAVMGPQAAINAVYYNQLQAIEDPDERAQRTEQLRAEYAADVDILHLASEIVIDAVVQPDDLRTELIRRYASAAKRRDWPEKRNPVTPSRRHGPPAARRPALPCEFAFGFATAGAQNEGGYNGPGSRPTTGWDWERNGHAEPSGIATESWSRYAEDLDAVAALGCDAYNLSVRVGARAAGPRGARPGRGRPLRGHARGRARPRHRALGVPAPLHASARLGLDFWLRPDSPRGVRRPRARARGPCSTRAWSRAGEAPVRIWITSTEINVLALQTYMAGYFPGAPRPLHVRFRSAARSLDHRWRRTSSPTTPSTTRTRRPALPAPQRGPRNSFCSPSTSSTAALTDLLLARERGIARADDRVPTSTSARRYWVGRAQRVLRPAERDPLERLDGPRSAKLVAPPAADAWRWTRSTPRPARASSTRSPADISTSGSSAGCTCRGR